MANSDRGGIHPVGLDSCEHGTQLRLRSINVVFVRDGQTFDVSVEVPAEGIPGASDLDDPDLRHTQFL